MVRPHLSIWCKTKQAYAFVRIGLHEINGASDRNRTRNQLITNQLLYR